MSSRANPRSRASEKFSAQRPASPKAMNAVEELLGNKNGDVKWFLVTVNNKDKVVRRELAHWVVLTTMIAHSEDYPNLRVCRTGQNPEFEWTLHWDSYLPMPTLESLMDEE